MGAKIQTFKDVAKVALRKVVFFCVSVLIVEKASECKRLSILNALLKKTLRPAFSFLTLSIMRNEEREQHRKKEKRLTLL